MPDRRALVGFDPDHFAKQAAVHGPLDAASAFGYAYRRNLWGGADTPSGAGSSVAHTSTVAARLPGLLHRLEARTLLDLPCGTCHWMVRVDLAGVRYIGADIVPEVVDEAQRRCGAPDRQFLVLDLIRSDLPPADVLLCRDCLVHLSFADIANAIENVRRSAITYLLATTFTNEQGFRDIVTGDWRPLNLQRPPFSFPPPLELLMEDCTEHDGAFADKALGLWRVRDLPVLPRR